MAPTKPDGGSGGGGWRGRNGQPCRLHRGARPNGQIQADLEPHGPGRVRRRRIARSARPQATPARLGRRVRFCRALGCGRARASRRFSWRAARGARCAGPDSRARPAGYPRAGEGDGQGAARQLHERLAMLQQRLFAEADRSILLVLQGLDASGKDGVTRSVFTGLNPLSCRAVAFKAPSKNELTRDYLWRVHAVAPARGEIGIFNRSHYEDVVTVRVEGSPEAVWRRRPSHIREWERLLSDEGTAPVKVYLDVSKDEQRTAPAEANRQPRETLEVPARRSRHAQAVRGLRRRVRGRAHRDIHKSRHVARRPRRSQLGEGRRGRSAARRCTRADRPQLPPADPAIEGLRVE